MRTITRDAAGRHHIASGITEQVTDMTTFENGADPRAVPAKPPARRTWTIAAVVLAAALVAGPGESRAQFGPMIPFPFGHGPGRQYHPGKRHPRTHEHRDRHDTERPERQDKGKQTPKDDGSPEFKPQR